MRMQDFQRARVYKAERCVFCPTGEWFPHYNQAIIDKVRAAPVGSTDATSLIIRLGKTRESRPALGVHAGRKFMSVEEMQAYVDALLKTAWWKRRFQVSSITVRYKTRGTTSMCICMRPGVFILNMARWSWFEAVLLHEIAHAATSGDQHGPRFTRALLELYWHELGKEAYQELKRAYKKFKVEWSRAMPTPNWITYHRITI